MSLRLLGLLVMVGAALAILITEKYLPWLILAGAGFVLIRFTDR